jgi:hypothetical protein
VGPDLSVPAFGRMLLALAEAPGGTTPARAHAALQAAGVRTVNRAPLLVQSVRQMACRLEREQLALINRGIGNDWTITATGMVPAADSTTTSTTPEEPTMSTTKLATTTCTTCGATVTTKNMARHRKSPACTVNGKVRSEAATIAKATKSTVDAVLAPSKSLLPVLEVATKRGLAQSLPVASKAQVAPKQPAGPKAKPAKQPKAKAAKQAADKPQHQPGERGYRAPGAGVVGADPRLPPVGTVITKLYKGTEHRVTILADGVEHLGVKYKNLRKVVKVITGANNVYSLLFFGIVPPKGKADAQAGA